MPCAKFADCSCGEGCSCADCTCGTVTHKDLADIKASGCKYGDCSCGDECGCGADCKCGGSVEKTEEQWIAMAKKTVAKKAGAPPCPWTDCTCKQNGGSCSCGESCGCGSTKV